MRKVFRSTEPFGALYAAQKFCRDNGISCAAEERAYPIGIMFGDCDIAKWTNLTEEERSQLHGTMKGHLRHGPITVAIKPEFDHLLVAEAS